MASIARASGIAGPSGRQMCGFTPGSALRVKAVPALRRAPAQRPCHRLRSSGKDGAPTEQPAAGGAAAAPLLSSPEQQTAAFNFLSYTSAAFAAAALIAPGPLLDFALPGAQLSGLDDTFVQIAGATMVLSAATESRLADAAANKRLTSATYQRLMAACAIKSLGYLAAFAQAGPLWSPTLVALYPTAALASVAINAAVLNASGAKLETLFVPSAPKTAIGWTYAVFVVLYLATAAACYAPEAIFTGAPVEVSSELLKHTWAPGFLLGAAVCFVQQDAADRGRLGAGTFKTLNLGLAGLEVLYSILMFKSISIGLVQPDPAVYSNIGGSVAIAGVCMFQYFTAKK